MSATQYKFTPTHEFLLTSRKQKIASQSQQHKSASHWPEEDSKIIVALIRKLNHTHSNQQIAEEYLREYVPPVGEWHPGLQVVINKVKNEKQSLVRGGKEEE
ncbi:hypothetical protein HK097_001969 [Rhizophlyctis rosea]|uniref:Uncharacterized protein n=1 Tax=Rhizophlyctis rosea TaxID=64517 RepID=A0AAD5S5E6_9FUNG|nr:hypothetical protein HK097_001969 [Rhizophlyctis rosea]